MAQLKTRLEEQAELIHKEFATPIEMREGADALNLHDEKRRIVWVTPGGTIAAPPQAGGRMADDDDTVRIVACRLRSEDVDVHLFGSNRADAEQMLDATIAAIHKACGPSARITSYSYPNEEQDKTGVTRRTHKCVLKIQLRMPVPEEIAPLREITGADHECGTIQDDGSITPQ